MISYNKKIRLHLGTIDLKPLFLNFASSYYRGRVHYITTFVKRPDENLYSSLN